MRLRDLDLKETLLNYISSYGSSIQFVANSIGVSREHLSRWLHNDNYVISIDLKKKKKTF